jgi:hypothetical protein
MRTLLLSRAFLASVLYPYTLTEYDEFFDILPHFIPNPNIKCQSNNDVNPNAIPY